MTSIVRNFDLEKSTILNLIAKYYEAQADVILIVGKPIESISAERKLEQILMIDVKYCTLMDILVQLGVDSETAQTDA